MVVVKGEEKGWTGEGERNGQGRRRKDRKGERKGRKEEDGTGEDSLRRWKGREETEKKG